MSRLKKYHLPHDGYKWRSDGRDKKWPQTTKIYYKCISVEGCSAKLHFFPHTKEIQYVGEHNHPKAGGTEEEQEEAVAPASPATATVVTVAACAAVIPPEVYQRPVRQSTRRQRSCVDAMSYLDDESDDREDEEEEEEEYDDEEAYVPHNYHSTSTSPASSDVESSPARSRAGSIGARPRARPDEQQQLVNIEEDVAIFLGAMQSEQKKEVSPTAVSRKRKANDESSPYMSEADDDDGGPPNTDNKCPHCGKVFQNRSTFVHHWRVVVQREQQRDCPICHEIISTWYNMKRHLGNVHKWSTQQIENERSRITSPASPQLAEPQYLQVPPHQPQAQQRRKKVKSEEASPTLVPTSPQLQSPQSQPQPQPQPQPCKQQPAAQWPERSGSAVEVKMEVVSAEEGEEEEGADGDETTKHSSIRSRRARKAAAAAAARSCGDGDGAGGRVESMLERLMALYEQDRAGRCGGDAEVREQQQLRHQQLQLQEQELRLREERVEMREREVEQRERDQLARLHLREEAMLLRERELELVIRERTLALALSSAATVPTPQQ